MIIDVILDRQHTDEDWYDQRWFDYIKDEAEEFEFDYILEAIRSGSEDKMKLALIKYILENDYNPEIIGFILEEDWLLRRNK